MKSLLSFFAIKNLDGKKITYQNCNVLLTKNDLAPFSFWNMIYMGDSYANDGNIDPRIYSC
ncbi:hypothetical protein [Chryseobacterium indologenes]|uniref:hypothetical protein n=1 Tax=Chryseobacterium indologenes TaxID=253 RepID=UPI000B51CBBC|nr:hypothetical protein [Chryseobacterium indologenes]ASE63155.1 hypothetical protein CEQ15_17485 [Chryseobacterium indologenes]VFA42713.1 Uncharacterised protein [Chryseobacterium indologenes]